MALNDVPLGDAGRNYYQQQFGSRVQNIRKYGATPPAAKSGCLGTGGFAGGGIVALLILVRVIIAFAVGVGGSNYNSGSNYSTPTIQYNTPPPTWNNDLKVDPPPFQNDHPWANPDWRDRPDFRPVDPNPPIFVPDDPARIPDPPIFVPDEGPKDDR